MTAFLVWLGATLTGSALVLVALDSVRSRSHRFSLYRVGSLLLVSVVLAGCTPAMGFAFESCHYWGNSCYEAWQR